MKFYTYIWLRYCGTPYYVGKGSGKRYISPQHSCHKPPTADRILVQYFPDETSAFAAEIFLVSYYGRKDLGTGCLHNHTDGGENPPSWSGKKHSAETKSKIRNSNLGKKHSAKTLEKITLANQRNAEKRKGIPRSPECCAKMSAAMKGRKLSAEWIAKLIAARKGKQHSEETRQKMVAAQKMRRKMNPVSAETRAKISAAAKQRHANRGIDAPIGSYTPAYVDAFPGGCVVLKRALLPLPKPVK